VGRPKTFDPDEAIRAATRVFQAYGYAASSPTLLADAVGVGKGSLYHAFGTKHELFMACLNRYAAEEYAEFQQLLDQPGPVRDRIRRVFEAAAAADQADPARPGCLIVNTATERGLSDAEASTVVWDSIARTRTALREVLAEGARAGEVETEQDLDALADMLQCTMIGLRVLGRGSANQDSIRAVIESAIENI